MFQEQADRISMVVLDVVMPSMGGREAYERMRALRPALKVLFASGYSGDAIHQDYMQENGLTLLPKPYAPSELLHAVRQILDSDL